MHVCSIYFLTLSSLMSNRSTAVRTVFLLIRAKRGASPASRLDSLLSSQLFDTVKAQVRYCCFLAFVGGSSVDAVACIVAVLHFGFLSLCCCSSFLVEFEPQTLLPETVRNSLLKKSDIPPG